ncbi:hypothetical protein ACHAW5_006253, partial [Stephanodiscus triporus]
ILVGLVKFRRVTGRATKTTQLVALLASLALVVFFCGVDRLLRAVDHVDTTARRIVDVLTATVSVLTSAYLFSVGVPILLDGTDKRHRHAAALGGSVLEPSFPLTIRERRTRGGGKDDMPSLRRTTVFDSVEDDEYQNGDLGSDVKFPDNSISRSDLITIRRIQDFIQTKRKLISTVVADFSPIAASFPDTSIMFADISNFTSWSSVHTANQVFDLLESLFSEFDNIAKEMDVFHISTVGDCYIASTGAPYPREDHAVLLVQFAQRCRSKANEVLKRLIEQNEMTGISELKIRIGIHSGPVLAGVLRGNNRFDVFGDTMNTASRIESTGEPDRIHLSKDTAELLEKTGQGEF